MQEEIENEIINNPIDEIESLEYSVEKRKLSIRVLEEIIADKKDEMFLVVENEYEEDKKNPKLSNADKRKIETKKRLSEDICYVKVEDELWDKIEVQMVEEVRLRALNRQFIRDFCQGRVLYQSEA